MNNLDFIRRHSATARRIARAYKRKLPDHISLADLEQAALIGVFDWKRKHPDEDSDGWMGGLVLRIRGAIQDELRALDWMPRHARARGERFPSRTSDVLAWGVPSLDPSPEEALALKQAAAEAQRAALPERCAQVIDLAHYRDQTHREIAKSMGVSEARVSQLHADAINIMRRHLNPAVCERVTRTTVARLKAEGVQPAEAARRLGITHQQARTLWKNLAPLAKCEKRGEETR